MKSQDWMSTFMVVLVLMLLGGFRNGNIVQNAGETISIVIAILAALIIVFLPLNYRGGKWALLASTGLGAIAVILFGIGAVQSPTTIWTYLSAAAGVLIVIFGIRAYRAPSTN